MRAAQLAAELEGAARHLIVRGDLAVAGVADEEIAAEATEALGRVGESPRRIQLAATRNARDQVAVEVILIDEAEPLSRDLVLSSGVLLRIRDEDAPGDRLDPERGVAIRKHGVDERALFCDEVPRVVENVDARVVGVGRVQARRPDCEALVDRSDAPRSTAGTATHDGASDGTAGLQPLVIPVSLAKMNRAGPESLPSETTKLDPPLKAAPVGAPPGTATTSGLISPVSL
jgi:hypothetical protein